MATLLNPVTFTSNSFNTFAAPAGTALAANTTYWVSVNEGVASGNRLPYSSTDGNGQTGASGWSIADGYVWRTSESENWTNSNFSLMIRVNGSIDTGDLLVSNTGQAHDQSPTINHSAAQQFTTGSNPGGYSLDSAGFWIISKNNDSALTVTLRASDSNVPGAVIHTLTSPTLAAGAVNTFTAAEGATISADTDYFLVIEETAGSITMRATASAAEDAGGLTGFSIADSRLWCSATCDASSTWNSVAGSAIQIVVSGSAKSGTPPEVRVEFVQTAIEVAEGDSADIHLRMTSTAQPTHGFLLEFTAAPGTATAADYALTSDRATFLPSDFTENGDGDWVATRIATRVQIVDDAAGEDAETFQVEIAGLLHGGTNEAVPGTIGGPLTVTIAASDGGGSIDTVSLVSNTGQAHDQSPTINHSAAQQFTTGSNATGYSLDSVGYLINSISGSPALTVTLRASVSNVPGDVIHTFTSPSLAAGVLNTFTAQEGATLSADTDYFLVIEETAGSITMRATASAAEDAGGPAGFGIADSRQWCNAPCNASDWGTVAGSALQVVVSGSALASVPPGALVSNIGQAHSASPTINHSAAQQFTTGSNPGGYSLDSAGFWIISKSDDSALTVTLRESVQGTPDVPGDVIHTFTSPTLAVGAVNTFTATEGASLSAGTDYFLVIEETAGSITMRATASGAEDAGGLTGFGIADSRLWCNAPCDASDWGTVAGSAIQIVVSGSAVEPAVEIWSGTLTVRTAERPNDILAGTSPPGGSLDDTTFDHDGSSYTIDAIDNYRDTSTQENELDFSLSSGGLDASDLTLHVDGEPFAFGDASYDSQYHTWNWTEADLDWADGDTVALSITKEPADPPRCGSSSCKPPLRWRRGTTRTFKYGSPLPHDPPTVSW